MSSINIFVPASIKLIFMLGLIVCQTLAANTDVIPDKCVSRCESLEGEHPFCGLIYGKSCATIPNLDCHVCLRALDIPIEACYEGGCEEDACCAPDWEDRKISGNNLTSIINKSVSKQRQLMKKARNQEIESCDEYCALYEPFRNGAKNQEFDSYPACMSVNGEYCETIPTSECSACRSLLYGEVLDHCYDGECTLDNNDSCCGESDWYKRN